MARIYCITDPESRVAVVMEKRPRQWWRLGRWDLVSGLYEEGAWFCGLLYPQRCDLSPGGLWFSYFAFKPNSDWPAGESYDAISRMPWLQALAAWREIGTYSRGYHFVEECKVWDIGDATVGDVNPCRESFGMRRTEPEQFSVARRRGWKESESTPPRSSSDVWDDLRKVTMEKPSPVDDRAILSVNGRFQAERGLPDVWPPDLSAYVHTRKGRATILTGVQWADWTFEGHLAQATEDGRLLIWDTRRKRAISETSLGFDQPKPKQAPDWAGQW